MNTGQTAIGLRTGKITKQKMELEKITRFHVKNAKESIPSRISLCSKAVKKEDTEWVLGMG